MGGCSLVHGGCSPVHGGCSLVHGGCSPVHGGCSLVHARGGAQGHALWSMLCGHALWSGRACASSPTRTWPASEELEASTTLVRA
jgi:hypothetical protein